jgi:RNA polymerase sigma-70 factor (ECF subfamily)
VTRSAVRGNALIAPTVSPDEHRLVASIQKTGDLTDFDALYRMHTDVLYAVALRITTDTDRAADAVHDTWLRAIETLPHFEHRSRFRTWLTGILLNRLREEWRADFTDSAVDITQSEAVRHLRRERELVAELVIPAQLTSVDLERAIAALAPGFRTAIVLHDIEGYTHEEIASLTGTTSGTSKSQLARARSRLRELLEPSINRQQVSNDRG